MEKLFPYCKGCNIPYLSFFLFVVITLITDILLVFIPQINANFFNGDASLKSVTMFIGAELLSSFLVQIGLYFNHVTRAKINRNLRNVLWEKILRVKPRYYDKVNSTTLLSRITSDTESLNAFLLDIIWQIVFSVYLLFLTLEEMSKISLKASFILLAFVPLSLLINFIMGRINIRLENLKRFSYSNLTEYFSELIASLAIVKSFNQQDYETKRGESVVHEDYKNTRSIIGLDVLRQIISSIFGSLPEIAIIFMGVKLLNSNSIDAAGWYIFYLYAGSLLSFVVELGGFFEKTKTIQGQLATVTSVLLEDEESVDHYVEKIIDSDDIIFDKVFFGYGDEPVIRDLTFTINENETFAIIGHSGSGKSTVLKLIERMYEPDEGRILYQGKNFNEYDIHSWRDHISVVSQDTPMISGSIKDNLLYGVRHEVSDEEIDSVIDKCYLRNYIDSLPDGIDHQVGQFGSNISGGQKQKISIARALLCDPSVLILDEPVSNLDIISVREIANTISTLHKKITVVIVTHHQSMLEISDRCLVMHDDGSYRVGTKEELIAIDQFYKKLITEGGNE